MLKKTITSDFFTTISLKKACMSLYLMTFGSYKLRYGSERKSCTQELGRFLGIENKEIVSFYNGRSALFHALTLIGKEIIDYKEHKNEKWGEVIVCSYTCVSVSNAVIQSGASIKYSDIETDTLSFDYEILVKNITDTTRVIVIQHTFGMQARDYNKIIKLAHDKRIVIIEDCALSLGNSDKILGDFAIFSTGRDKVISSVTGGFLLINNSHFLSKNIEKLQMPSRLLTFQNLNYNIAGYKAYKLYDFFRLGKIIIFLSRKFHCISEILTPHEKKCNFKKFDLLLPNSLCYLFLFEIKNINFYTQIRKNNAEYLMKNIIHKDIIFPFLSEKNSNNTYNYFRIPILLPSGEDVEKLYSYMRENNILLGKTWTGIPIVPVGTDLEKAGYTFGSCTVSENISSRILFLPNHIALTQKDLTRIVDTINDFKNS